MVNNVYLQIFGNDAHVLDETERGADDEAAAVVQVEELESIVLLPPGEEECRDEDFSSPIWHWVSLGLRPEHGAVVFTVALGDGTATEITVGREGVSQATLDLGDGSD